MWKESQAAPKATTEGCSLPISQFQRCPLQQVSEEEQENTKTQSRQEAVAGPSNPQPPNTKNRQESAVLRGTPQQNKRQNIHNEAVTAMNKRKVLRNEHKTGQSMWAPTVNSTPMDYIFRVVSLVQQTMAEISDADSEQARTMATRIHRPLKIIAFNANGILRQ
jgi:hypothetical protein